MRTGEYREKTDPSLPGATRHRIVIPVFVPELDGYFQHAREILGLCLGSLRRTLGDSARVTIVANAVVEPVEALLRSEFDDGWIDQIILNLRNLGKVDAVVQQLRSAHESFVTIADADALFTPGWLQAVERTFASFPEAGAVAPLPNPRATWSMTSTTVLGAFLRREIGREPVVSTADLDRFAVSLGNPEFFSESHKSSQVIVRRRGAVACVGCGHFVVTLRREVAAGIPERPSLTAVSNDSERYWLDAPVDRLGFWRLSTTRAWVHHMGNVPEPWMREEPTAEEADRAAPAEPPAVRRCRTARLPASARRFLARRVRRTPALRDPRTPPAHSP